MTKSGVKNPMPDDIREIVEAGVEIAKNPPRENAAVQVFEEPIIPRE